MSTTTPMTPPLRRHLKAMEARLLDTPPFQGLRGPEVWDVDPDEATRRRRHACPMRPFLVSRLADSLVRWESAADGDRALLALNLVRGRRVALLERWLAHDGELPTRGLVWGGRTARHTAILKAMQRLRQALQAAAPGYRHASGQQLPAAPGQTRSSLTTQTVQALVTAFQALGPPTFSQSAVHRVVAAILVALDVRGVQGKPVTAHGVKKLVARHPPAPKEER